MPNSLVTARCALPNMFSSFCYLLENIIALLQTSLMKGENISVSDPA